MGPPVASVSWDELLLHIIQNTISSLPQHLQALVVKSPMYTQTHGAPGKAPGGDPSAAIKYVISHGLSYHLPMRA